MIHSSPLDIITGEEVVQAPGHQGLASTLTCVLQSLLHKSVRDAVGEAAEAACEARVAPDGTKTRIDSTHLEECWPTDYPTSFPAVFDPFCQVIVGGASESVFPGVSGLLKLLFQVCVKNGLTASDNPSALPSS